MSIFKAKISNNLCLELDWSKTFLFENSATEGNEFAQYWMGFFYECGVGFEGENIEKALHWYLESAKQGLAISQYHVACILYYKKSLQELAVKWFKESAKQGNEFALHELNEIDKQGL